MFRRIPADLVPVHHEGTPAVAGGTAAARTPRRSAHPSPQQARETSGATTGGLLRYVRTQHGDAAVTEVIARAGVRADPAELDDQSRWWSYDTRIRLFAAATEVLGDPDTMFKVGAAALHSGLAHSLVLRLRAMGATGPGR